MCTGGWFEDDDYPYLCVPELSYKTEDDDGDGWNMKKGDRCEIPKSDSDKVVYSGSEDENNNTIYFMYASDWTKYRTSYNDCKVQGIFKDSETWKEYFGVNGSNTSGISFEPYLACETILKVGQQSPDEKGNYNAAYTDRVWKSKPEPYSIEDDYEITIGNKTLKAFGYKPSTVPEIFGQAFGINKKLDKEIASDPYPHRVYMCQNNYNQKLATTDGAGTCDEDEDYEIKPGIGEARPYYDVELTTETQTNDWCFDTNCSCNQNGIEPNAVCNFDFGKNKSASCDEKKCVVVGDDPKNFNGVVCDENLGKETEGVDENGIKLTKECDDEADQAKKDQCYGELANMACAESSGTGSCTGTCNGGGNNNLSCKEQTDCEVKICVTKYSLDGFYDLCVEKGAPTDTLSIGEDEDKITDLVKSRLEQLFALSYDLLKFTNEGVYTLNSEIVDTFDELEVKSYSEEKVFPQGSNKSAFEWDTRAKEGIPPTVVSLGACVGTKCKEGKEGAFTVNDQDEGNILAKGSKRANVSFFAYADTDQMPIRNIVVDWGDDWKDITADGMPWPTDSQSGSKANDNFYKNHRGLKNVVGNNSENCSSDAPTFGESPEACSSNYVVFSHDYACSQADVNALETRECEFVNGRLINSPCLSSTKEGKAACVFQPRVHVKDNWGWCTGFCNAGADGKDGCYSGDGEKNNECQINVCPSEGKNDQCPDTLNPGKTDNPWINYDGTIIVEVE